MDGTGLDQYFPSRRANEFTLDHMVVNVLFINQMSVTEDATWDMVPKDNKNHGTIVTFGTLYEWGLDKLEFLRQEWGMEQVESLQQE